MIIPNEGKIRAIQLLTRAGTFFYPAPFTNDYTPSDTTVKADLALTPIPGGGAMSGAGGPIAATLITFGAAAIVGNQAVKVSNPFTFTGWQGSFPFTVYGFAVLVDDGDYELFCATRFATPIVIASASDEITRDWTLTVPA